MTWLDRNVTELGGRRLAPETLMMGYGYFPGLSEGSVKCPLFQTSTFVFRSAAEGKRFFELGLATAAGIAKLQGSNRGGRVRERVFSIFGHALVVRGSPSTIQVGSRNRPPLYLTRAEMTPTQFRDPRRPIRPF